MESIRFCSLCGGVLENGFLYCPYCGTELRQKPLTQDILKDPLERLEHMAKASSFKRLECCGDALERLEKDLDLFLSGRAADSRKMIQKQIGDADFRR